jgi:hypothetical protein
MLTVAGILASMVVEDDCDTMIRTRREHEWTPYLPSL